jgi:ATP-binding cassette subfamily C (CFTR/MRP) protein 1
MLVIAHRVATVADADRVLVLDAGAVVEYGPPSELLADPASAFAQLAARSAS